MISEIPGFVVEGRQVLTFGINPRRLWIFFSFDFRHMVYQIFPRLNKLIKKNHKSQMLLCLDYLSI